MDTAHGVKGEMKMKLFDVKTLKEWIENWFEVNAYYHPYSKSNNIPIPELYDILKRMPTVDAEPVRHGKWIIRDNPGTGWYSVSCSECGENVTDAAPCIGFFPNVKVIWDYCPYCGAKKDEEEGS